MDALKWDTLKGAVLLGLTMPADRFNQDGTVLDVVLSNCDALGRGEHRPVRDFGGNRPVAA